MSRGKIYELVGRNIEEFQTLENNLYLLIFIFEKSHRCENNFKQTHFISEKMLGEKLKKIKKLQIFQDKNDILVLDYLRDKRNYIVHQIFIENLNSINIKDEITEIYEHTKIINTALKRIIKSYSNNK